MQLSESVTLGYFDTAEFKRRVRDRTICPLTERTTMTDHAKLFESLRAIFTRRRLVDSAAELLQLG